MMKLHRIIPSTSFKAGLEASPAMIALKQLYRDRLAVAGAAMVLTFTFMAVFAQWISPFDPLALVARPNIPPSIMHSMGTDHLGRDILTRIIWGSRISMTIAFLSVVIATSIGTVIGLISGYKGGRVDWIVMRLTDAFLTIPPILLALFLVALWGTGMFNLILAIAVLSIPQYIRLSRATALSVSQKEYVVAARAAGMSEVKILFTQILPNCSGPLVVFTAMRMGVAILLESSLSFLGLGVPPGVPTWGGMLSDGKGYLLIAPWVSFFPGLFIFLVVLSFNALADGLRDALDPRMLER